MLKNIGFFGCFITPVDKIRNYPSQNSFFSRFLYSVFMSLSSFLIGYYSFWDEIDYSALQNKEEQCGYLTAAYEVNTGKYVLHRVIGNLGICVIPELSGT